MRKSTALHVAASRGNRGVVKAILDIDRLLATAPLNADNECTPFEAALMAGSVDGVEAIL